MLVAFDLARVIDRKLMPSATCCSPKVSTSVLPDLRAIGALILLVGLMDNFEPSRTYHPSQVTTYHFSPYNVLLRQNRTVMNRAVSQHVITSYCGRWS